MTRSKILLASVLDTLIKSPQTTESCLNLIIEEPVIPCVRMTRRGKHLPRAQKYLAWKQAIAMQFVSQANGFRFNKKARLFVNCVFYVSAYVTVKDTDNLLKTINDTLQYSGVIPNDNQVYAVFGMKIPALYDQTDIQIVDIGEFVEKARFLCAD